MTELIAAIAGPYLVVTGLGFALSRGFYERMIRGGPAEIAVTLLGAAPVLKGVALIAVPEITLKPPTAVGRGLTAPTVGFLIAGAYFCYIGYWPKV